jgi:hypothetical protein
MTKYLAMIEIILPTEGGAPGYPAHPIYNPPIVWPNPPESGGPPPGIWPDPGHPAHPIAPGGPPPGIWPSPGHPAHPIAPGGRPPGIWGGAPGFPTHPIVIPPDAIAPGVPTHPIYWPPYPDQGLPPGEAHPEHPIIIPGDDEDNPKWEVKTAWSPQTGWMVVIVPTEEATVPSPANPAATATRRAKE